MKLRQEIEGEAREELQRARESLEAEGRTSASGKLCATPFGIDVVGISQASLETPGEFAEIRDYCLSLSHMQSLGVSACEDSSLHAGGLLDGRPCRR